MKKMNTLLMVLLLFVGFSPMEFVSAQEEIVFRDATVENIYPDGVLIRIEVCGRPQGSHVYFNYKYPGNWDAYWWYIDEWTLDEGQTQDDCDKRKVFLETKDLYLPPFSPIKFYWSVSYEDKILGKSVEYTHYYKNDEYEWNSLERNEIVIWWHDRPNSFGEEILQVAEKAIGDQESFYSIKLNTPVTIVIFNSSDEFFSWQAEEGYAGGIAFPEVSLTTQLVSEVFGYEDWVADVVPHELSHLFFYQISSKQLRSSTKWLDEGLATYSEYGNHWFEWQILREGYDAGKLVSFKYLEYTFGDDPDQVDLFYAQSYYAVLYLEEVYGREKVSELIDEYSKGSGLESCFRKVLGVGLDEFNIEYVEWLGERLNTPPPDTSLVREKRTSMSTYFIVAACCFGGGLFVLAFGGVILVGILLSNASKDK